MRCALSVCSYDRGETTTDHGGARLISWPTSGLAVGLWSTQMMVTNGYSKSPVDFLLNVINPVRYMRVQEIATRDNLFVGMLLVLMSVSVRFGPWALVCVWVWTDAIMTL